MSLQKIMRDQCNKLDELKMATVLIRHKDALEEQLSQAKEEVSSIVMGVASMKKDLEIMRDHNVKCRNLLALFAKIEARSDHIEASLTPELLQELTRFNRESLPVVAQSDNENCRKGSDNYISRQVEIVGVKNTECRLDDCKKTLFKNAEDSYSIELLGPGEFSKIPKYIIGRQSLTVLNEFLTTVNHILDAKYTLLGLGKNGARKKGKLDLYLSLKREEIVVEPGKEPIYFFTAEDYHRHTQTKLDKAKLNLLTALRHCKRLRELRVGKSLLYVIIPASESSRGGTSG